MTELIGPHPFHAPPSRESGFISLANTPLTSFWVETTLKIKIIFFSNFQTQHFSSIQFIPTIFFSCFLISKHCTKDILQVMLYCPRRVSKFYGIIRIARFLSTFQNKNSSEQFSCGSAAFGLFDNSPTLSQIQVGV